MTGPPARVTVSIDVDEERIRAIVREEIASAAPGAGTCTASETWATTGRAAKACGVGRKRVTALIAANAIQWRLRNLDPEKCKQKKYEVNVESLRAALRGETAPEPRSPIDAAAWKRARGG